MPSKILQSKNKINIYLSNTILSRPPEFLILDLYDGCVKFLNNIKESLENDDNKNFEYFSKKVNDILKELLKSLDLERGGEIAQNLKKLYLFCLKNLEDLKKDKEIKKIEEIKKIIKILRDAWNDGVIKIRQK